MRIKFLGFLSQSYSTDQLIMTNLPEEILEGCLKENKSVVEKLSGLGAEDFEKVKLLGKGDVGRGTKHLSETKFIWFVSKTLKNTLP
jgi:hypothetical protein